MYATRIVLAVLVVGGCSAKIQDLPNDEFEDPEVRKACAARSLPVQPLRRLASRQYANAIRDLFGRELADPLLVGSRFPATVITTGFTNDAAANTVNTTQANAIEDEAQRIASSIIANPQPYLRQLCNVTTVDEAQIDGCVDTFVASFGRRAYRRPLTADEVARARGVYDAVRTTQGALNAWASLIQYFVQAPQLLYRIERGGEPGPTPGS